MRQQSDGNNLPLPPRIAKRSRRGHNSNWRRRPCAFVRFKSRCPLCPRQLMPTANCGLPQSFRPKPLSQFRTFRRSRKKRSTSPFGKGRTHPAFETKYVRIAAATKPALLFSALSSPRAQSPSSIRRPHRMSSPSISPKRPCPTRRQRTRQMFLRDRRHNIRAST